MLGIFSTNSWSTSPCSSGYTGLTGYIDSNTFAAPVNGACNFGDYSLVTIPDEYDILYSGLLIGTAVPLCTNGRKVNGECVAYAQGDCASGEYDVVENVEFIAPVNGSCSLSGYGSSTIPDEYHPLYPGMLIGTEAALCTNGHRSNGACVAYTQGEECANGYYDLGPDANTFSAPDSNNVCSNPYSVFAGATRCDHNPGEMCVTVPTPTIDINWYDGDTLMSSGSCLYGDGFVLPEAPPEREGYVFTGWRLRFE